MLFCAAITRQIQRSISQVYELLLLFARNPGIAMYRETIYERVWNEPFPYGSKTVDLHIQRLRKKLGWEEVIHAVPKVGYRLEA